MGLVGIVALVAVGVLVLSWLAVSFSASPRSRMILARVGSLAMYVALLCLFFNLTRRAWLEDSTVALVAFGFLLLIFVGGLGLSATKLVGELRGRTSVQSSATN